MLQKQSHYHNLDNIFATFIRGKLKRRQITALYPHSISASIIFQDISYKKSSFLYDTPIKPPYATTPSFSAKFIQIFQKEQSDSFLGLLLSLHQLPKRTKFQLDKLDFQRKHRVTSMQQDALHDNVTNFKKHRGSRWRRLREWPLKVPSNCYDHNR